MAEGRSCKTRNLQAFGGTITLVTMVIPQVLKSLAGVHHIRRYFGADFLDEPCPGRNVDRDIFCIDLSAVREAELLQPGLHFAFSAHSCVRKR